MIVVHGEYCLLERSPFNLDQEIRKFALSGQCLNPKYRNIKSLRSE